jgi:hypothetical protein
MGFRGIMRFITKCCALLSHALSWLPLVVSYLHSCNKSRNDCRYMQLYDQKKGADVGPIMRVTMTFARGHPENVSDKLKDMLGVILSA